MSLLRAGKDANRNARITTGIRSTASARSITERSRRHNESPADVDESIEAGDDAVSTPPSSGCDWISVDSAVVSAGATTLVREVVEEEKSSIVVMGNQKSDKDEESKSCACRSVPCLRIGVKTGAVNYPRPAWYPRCGGRTALPQRGRLADQ